MQLRIGQGIDIHAFEKSPSTIRLGGIDIPSEYRIVAHSDGDILLHAISDAILGALGEADIGTFFPETPENRNIDSTTILEHALQLMRSKDFQIINMDITLLAEVPKIKPYREKIIGNIARLCRIPEERIALKATTNEKLGFIGRKEGIACFCVVLLSSF